MDDEAGTTAAVGWPSVGAVPVPAGAVPVGAAVPIGAAPVEAAVLVEAVPVGADGAVEWTSVVVVDARIAAGACIAGRKLDIVANATGALTMLDAIADALAAAGGVTVVC